MKGGITRRLEDTIKALDEGKLKRALTLTDGIPKLKKHHSWVVEAAQTCLADKKNKKVCEEAIMAARAQIKGTTELPEDDVSLDGLEEYLTEGAPQGEKRTEIEKTDEELYAECEDCHVADAVAKFHEIAQGCGDDEITGLIEKQADDVETKPTTWIKQMLTIAEKDTCGQEKYRRVLLGLTDYLEKRDSPILKELDQEEENA
jgi:hypothetical protein